MPKVILSFILLLNVQLIHATVLLFIATKDGVILVIDSKQTYVSKRTATVNKLNHVGNYYFGVGGITYDLMYNFSVEEVVKSILVKNKTLEGIKKDMHLIKDALQSYLRDKQQHDFASYSRLRKMESSGEIFIATVENGNPMMIVYGYTLDSQNPVNVNAKWGVYFSSKIPKNVAGWQISQSSNWLKDKQPSDSAIASNPLKYAKWFAKESVNHNKESAGYPLKIVECTKQGCKELPPINK